MPTGRLTQRAFCLVKELKPEMRPSSNGQRDSPTSCALSKIWAIAAPSNSQGADGDLCGLDE